MKARAVFALVVTLAAFFFFFKLGERSFRNPDEGRYAEVAREMVASGNWIEPRLYGVDYLRKPILFYWLIALSFKCFGFNEYAARLVPALFGVLGVALTFLFAKKTMGERAAVFSSLLLMTNFWFLQVGRYLLIDMVFSFFVVASLYSFYLGTADTKKRGLYYTLFYISAGFAFLAKGVAGFVIPAVAVGTYMASERRTWGFFRPGRLLFGAAVVGAIAAPWFVLISLKEPEFLKFFFLHEHLKRFSSTDFEHQQAWFYYLWVIPAIFLPWSVLASPFKKAFLLIKNRADGGALLFSALSAAGIVVFYSLSRTKLPTYMLPVVPLICLVMGRAWQAWCDEAPSGNNWPLVVPGVALIFASIGFLAFSERIFAWVPARFQDADYTVSFRFIAGIVLAGSVAALRALLRGSRVRFFYRIVAMTGALSVVFSFILNSINENYTTKHFAQELAPKLKRGDKVFVYGPPGPFYDFQFYLGSRVRLVTLGGELALSESEEQKDGNKDDADDEQERAAWVTKDEFWDMARRDDPIYCLIRKSDYEGLTLERREMTRIISQDRRKVLFVTHSTGL